MNNLAFEGGVGGKTPGLRQASAAATRSPLLHHSPGAVIDSGSSGHVGVVWRLLFRGGAAMPAQTFRAETPLQALLVEQALALARELERAADAAPDGQVLARVEALAVPAGRELTRRAVEAALQRQAGAAEKKGRPAGAAPAAGRPPVTRGGPTAPS